ncbi:CPBP family intramembrane glutamic endopeptidase [Knoellia aerolata]|uniref:CAAX prenyl protease 2/Lysostaphin resistance protein A-like domain-containing protein n=1 Tax=Knoellia aerolata DSM 18566 TaxID=1385519 RepID=A0A0A0JVV0_9MICO|nr:CPBP family intramembrane glutamic endopeptidase [Knoellia aerolata]KGN40212.1 hypothetical protein N801_16220 [Knoellia aerolata DSM 18566]
MTTYEPTAQQFHRTPTTATVEQHSIARSMVLHLLPGAVLATLFYLAAPVAVQAGYPPIFAGVLAATVVVVGGELGWLMREAQRQTGSRSLGSTLPFRPGAVTWRKVLLVVGLVTWGLAVSVLSIGSSIKDSFFTWMPEWALDPLPTSFADSGSSSAQATTAVGYLLILVLAGPFIEELYFRGYLLPRIGRFGGWAPLINVTLFACYHLWKPWDVLNLILILGPAVYVVWRLKDIRISIAVHVALNGLGWALNVAPPLLFD